VPQVVCRICGICSVAHTSAAVKAIEAAAGIVPTEQTILLRKLILFGEQIQSHVLHLYFLAVPDYLGVGSVIPLAKTHPDVVRRALRMKKLANDLCATIGGRHIHPISYRVGGFSHLPSIEQLQDIKTRLEAARSDLDQTVELFEDLALPDYRRDTEYLALKSDDNEYAFYDGRLVSSVDARPTAPADYRRRVIESVVAHSTAKHSRSSSSDSYAVGALARFNVNGDRLHPAARDAAHRLGLKAPCRNPYHNNTAQLVEVVFVNQNAARGFHDSNAAAELRRPRDRPGPCSFAQQAVGQFDGRFRAVDHLDELGRVVVIGVAARRL
jgi:coenzyme F420-reducing hydrogenase alpha subunit